MLIERTFLEADQHAFAALSGDRNPMHIDALAARRMQAGAPVVHGVHAVLWALDSAARGGSPLHELNSISVQFTRFLPVGARIELRMPDPKQIELWMDGAPTTLIALGFGPRNPAGDSIQAPEIPILPQPYEPEFAALSSLQAWLRPEGNPSEMFPCLCDVLGPDRVAAVAMLSSIVGMICPGLHSVFTGIRITLTREVTRTGVGFSVAMADERFRALRLKVEGGGIAGSISALMRPGPVEPPSTETLRTIVSHDEFRGVQALVVGGSRGLGAITAKLLAAGGANVTLTYAQGKQDAEKVANETNGRIFQFDALDFDPDLIPQATHLYYFATTRIYRQTPGLFRPAVFDEFLQVYVRAFETLCRRLAPKAVLYPSSVFVTERPNGMTEYTMAKAAGEILCADLAKTGIRVVAPRLPRILTDQTATNVPTSYADPIETMLPIIRAMHRA